MLLLLLLGWFPSSCFVVVFVDIVVDSVVIMIILFLASYFIKAILFELIVFFLYGKCHCSYVHPFMEYTCNTDEVYFLKKIIHTKLNAASAYYCTSTMIRSCIYADVYASIHICTLSLPFILPLLVLANWYLLFLLLNPKP